MVRTDASTLRLEIADDGAGVDVESVRRWGAAVRRNSIDAIHEAVAGDVLDMIFQDDVSTVGDATELSGRGVGLAAVRSVVSAMGGEVRADTSAGQGTQFLFTIPLASLGLGREPVSSAKGATGKAVPPAAYGARRVQPEAHAGGGEPALVPRGGNGATGCS